MSNDFRWFAKAFVVDKISCNVCGGLEEAADVIAGFSQAGEKTEEDGGEINGLRREVRKEERVLGGGTGIRIEEICNG